MENEIYRKTIVPSKEATDGETPTVLHITEENNGFGVFLTDSDYPTYGKLLKWFSPYERNQAIEYGVMEAEAMLIAQVS